MKLSVCAKLSHFASFQSWRATVTPTPVLRRAAVLRKFAGITNTRAAVIRIAAIVLLLCVSLNSPLFSATINDTQIIKSDHWIYDTVYTLYTRTGRTCPASSFPITVGELKFLLRQIDVAELDDSTSRLYNEAHSFLYDDADLIGRFFSDEPDESASDATGSTNDGFKISVAPKLTPEAYVKSNDSVSWFFARQDPYLIDNFGTLPVCIGFGNLITIETDLFYGKNRSEARLNDNWTNLPLNGRFDYLYPRFAYGSTGIFHENWGVSLHIANEGLTLGKTLTGSVIYNRTFETASYAELNIYSNWGTYALDVSQVDYNRFMYLHHLEIHPFKQLKLALIEGGPSTARWK